MIIYNDKLFHYNYNNMDLINMNRFSPILAGFAYCLKEARIPNSVVMPTI